MVQADRELNGRFLFLLTAKIEGIHGKEPNRKFNRSAVYININKTKHLFADLIR